jgi:hypothetical protein
MGIKPPKAVVTSDSWTIELTLRKVGRPDAFINKSLTTCWIPRSAQEKEKCAGKPIQCGGRSGRHTTKQQSSWPRNYPGEVLRASGKNRHKAMRR